MVWKETPISSDGAARMEVVAEAATEVAETAVVDGSCDGGSSSGATSDANTSHSREL